MMSASIVVVQSIGQVGNRLEQFSHLLALHAQMGCTIINPAFWLYSEFFEGTWDDPLCRYPACHTGRPQKVAQRLWFYTLRLAMEAQLLRAVPGGEWISHHWTAGPYDLGNPHFQWYARNRRWIFLSGAWKHRHWSAYEPAIPLTQRHFRLVPALHRKIADHLAPLRTQCDVLVGLHVRQGDNFTDPIRRDAFPSEAYARVARQIPALFPGRRVAFLLCTNKPQPRELYEGLVIFDGPGEFILDMYALAECDYIIGAGQSSFNGWASLIGQKPRYRLFDPAKPISLDDFQVCRGVED